MTRDEWRLIGAIAVVVIVIGVAFTIGVGGLAWWSHR